MCIYTNSNKLSVAKEDIICYKVLFYDKGNDRYKSPHRFMDYTRYVKKSKTVRIFSRLNPFKQSYVEKDIVQFGTDGRTYVYDNRRLLHTYTNLTDAQKFKNSPCVWHYTAKNVSEFKIFKCIIPKNALYLKGMDNYINGHANYASTELKILEEVK